MSGFEDTQKNTFEKKDDIATLNFEDSASVEENLDEYFGDVDLENIQFEDATSTQKMVSKENLLLAQYPEIRKLIEETSDVDVDIDVNEDMAKMQVDNDLEERAQRAKLHREKICARNIQNFKEIVHIIAKREILDPAYTEEVIQSTVDTLMDDDNDVMEDPRIILDKIVPEAIDKIRAHEEKNTITH